MVKVNDPVLIERKETIEREIPDILASLNTLFENAKASAQLKRDLDKVFRFAKHSYDEGYR